MTNFDGMAQNIRDYLTKCTEDCPIDLVVADLDHLVSIAKAAQALRQEAKTMFAADELAALDAALDASDRRIGDAP